MIAASGGHGAPSSIHCSSVGTAKGEAGILALGEHVRDRRSRVTSQKQLDKGPGDPAHHILDWSYVTAAERQGVGDGSYSFTTPVFSIGRLKGSMSSSKVMKKTRVHSMSSGPFL